MCVHAEWCMFERPTTSSGALWRFASAHVILSWNNKNTIINRNFLN